MVAVAEDDVAEAGALWRRGELVFWSMLVGGLERVGMGTYHHR